MIEETTIKLFEQKQIRSVLNGNEDLELLVIINRP
jgi:hypothetical protein